MGREEGAGRAWSRAVVMHRAGAGRSSPQRNGLSAGTPAHRVGVDAPGLICPHAVDSSACPWS